MGVPKIIAKNEIARTGRPTGYTDKIAKEICFQLSTSSSGLNKICKPANMPSVRTVYNWLADERYSFFLQMYTRAREEQAHFMAEEIIEIADDGTNDLMVIEKGDARYEIENREVTNRSKLRVEARKWLAAKLLPRKYGDKVSTEHSGTIGIAQITGMEIK